jgi:hypothetical protein
VVSIGRWLVKVDLRFSANTTDGDFAGHAFQAQRVSPLLSS